MRLKLWRWLVSNHVCSMYLTVAWTSTKLLHQKDSWLIFAKKDQYTRTNKLFEYLDLNFFSRQSLIKLWPTNWSFSPSKNYYNNTELRETCIFLTLIRALGFIGSKFFIYVQLFCLVNAEACAGKSNCHSCYWFNFQHPASCLVINHVRRTFPHNSSSYPINRHRLCMSLHLSTLP